MLTSLKMKLSKVFPPAVMSISIGAFIVFSIGWLFSMTAVTLIGWISKDPSSWEDIVGSTILFGGGFVSWVVTAYCLHNKGFIGGAILLSGNNTLEQKKKH